MQPPETRYAKSGDVHIAYQIVGEGPIDLVFVPGFVSNVEFNWEQPGRAYFLTRLAGFSRLITFDKRGTNWRIKSKPDTRHDPRPILIHLPIHPISPSAT